MRRCEKCDILVEKLFCLDGQLYCGNCVDSLRVECEEILEREKQKHLEEFAVREKIE